MGVICLQSTGTAFQSDSYVVRCNRRLYVSCLRALVREHLRELEAPLGRFSMMSNFHLIIPS